MTKFSMPRCFSRIASPSPEKPVPTMATRTCGAFRAEPDCATAPRVVSVAIDNSLLAAEGPLRSKQDSTPPADLFHFMQAADALVDIRRKMPCVARLYVWQAPVV